MQKLFLFSIGLMLPVFVFAAGAGGGGGGGSAGSGGSSGVSGDTSGFLAPSVGSSCTKSTWVCSEWSSCTKEGKRERICTKTFDCPSDTTKPAEEEGCALPKKDLPPVRTHWCATLPLLKQRVECRLGLTEKDLEEEYKRQYLPEECRALRVKKQQNECVDRYKALQPCWEKPVGEERAACAREVLDVPEDLKEERIHCNEKKTRKGRLSCLTTLRQKVYHLVKFRFYDLNERVEEFLHEHATVDGRPGIRFIVASEINKQRFNTARTKAQRLQIIRNERAAWRQMVATLRLPEKHDFLDAAITDLSSVE